MTCLRAYTLEHPRENYDNIAGEDEAKAELREIVHFLRSPETYRRVGARAKGDLTR